MACGLYQTHEYIAPLGEILELVVTCRGGREQAGMSGAGMPSGPFHDLGIVSALQAMGGHEVLLPQEFVDSFSGFAHERDAFHRMPQEEIRQGSVIDAPVQSAHDQAIHAFDERQFFHAPYRFHCGLGNGGNGIVEIVSFIYAAHVLQAMRQGRERGDTACELVEIRSCGMGGEQGGHEIEYVVPPDKRMGLFETEHESVRFPVEDAASGRVQPFFDRVVQAV